MNHYQIRSHLIGVDLNPVAASISRQTARQNKVTLDAIHGDLTTPFQSLGRIDLLLFNPPYVPTESSEMHDAYRLALHPHPPTCDSSHTDSLSHFAPLLTLAWAGGASGREVLDRFLHLLFPSQPAPTEPPRCIYLLLLEENKPAEIVARFEAQGYHSRSVSYTHLRAHET